MFEWEVTINLHAENGAVIFTTVEHVYAATLHDARGKADKLGQKLSEVRGADFWAVVSVV